MAKVKFGMIWLVTGTQEVNLPDNINPDNEQEVISYLKKNWLRIPIPDNGEYLSDTDVLDKNYPIEIIKE